MLTSISAPITSTKKPLGTLQHHNRSIEGSLLAEKYVININEFRSASIVLALLWQHVIPNTLLIFKELSTTQNCSHALLVLFFFFKIYSPASKFLRRDAWSPSLMSITSPPHHFHHIQSPFSTHVIQRKILVRLRYFIKRVRPA